MITKDKDSQDIITPEIALEFLKAGNGRFFNKTSSERDYHYQILETAGGQFPFAVILSCIDSRVPTEIIFDQGIGNLFNARIAGNLVNEDILGSMEFACKLAGTKLVVVLGHTACGAVKGACDDAKLGNLTTMLAKIKPAVNAVTSPADASLRNSSNSDFVDNVSAKNVQMSIARILKESEVLAEMAKNGEIKIIGGMYDINTGAVDFYE